MMEEVSEKMKNSSEHKEFIGTFILFEISGVFSSHSLKMAWIKLVS